MMPSLYPVFLNLDGRRVLVAGAGRVAGRRIGDLLSSGADISVVAPSACAKIEKLAANGSLKWHRRPFNEKDIDGASYVLAATDDHAANELVGKIAARRGIPCCVASAGATGSAQTPATARSGEITVAVSTGGKSPSKAKAAARSIRRFLGKGRIEKPGRPVKKGCVYLVGAGPGDPGLLTIRGREIVEQADVIFHDRLSGEGILKFAGPGARLIQVGRRAGEKGSGMEWLVRALAREAREDKIAVHLKGGDPMLFACAREEMDGLERLGAEFEVVPGISAAFAAAASFKFPLTQRGVSASVSLKAGDALSKGSGETAVFYMGLGRIKSNLEKLVADGWKTTTPVAVIFNASLPGEKAIRGMISDISAKVASVKGDGPALVVVGETVRSRENHAKQVFTGVEKAPGQAMTGGK